MDPCVFFPRHTRKTTHSLFSSHLPLTRISSSYSQSSTFTPNTQDKMTSLHALPEELLDRIMHFSPLSSLHALTLVSKTLSRIATSHLYTTIALTRHSFKYLRPLTLLLWTSPKHRHLVRSISVSRAYGGNLVPWPRYTGLDALIEEQVGLYVRKEERKRWSRQVRDGGDALAIASLLLRSLPHVRRMGFDGFELVDPGDGSGGV
ncbi:hypothetical protein BDU57DRAFT_523562 [Ampelomyces quisqualis]|uniref:F-box domain-containing protein n=1 Tax=Ampelomyces quisqualis TaxID=50730 RepID=A0A6A5Q927_AMPQU|nr:hypothetical protein BDU57DRAFT_523562 [Ampelomyces quisqualis]